MSALFALLLIGGLLYFMWDIQGWNAYLMPFFGLSTFDNPTELNPNNVPFIPNEWMMTPTPAVFEGYPILPTPIP